MRRKGRPGSLSPRELKCQKVTSKNQSWGGGWLWGLGVSLQGNLEQLQSHLVASLGCHWAVPLLEWGQAP